MGKSVSHQEISQNTSFEHGQHRNLSGKAASREEILAEPIRDAAAIQDLWGKVFPTRKCSGGPFDTGKFGTYGEKPLQPDL
jgi:hypothetical protein